jgi:Zn-finger protein
MQLKGLQESGVKFVFYSKYCTFWPGQFDACKPLFTICPPAVCMLVYTRQLWATMGKLIP